MLASDAKAPPISDTQVTPHPAEWGVRPWGQRHRAMLHAMGLAGPWWPEPKTRDTPAKPQPPAAEDNPEKIAIKPISSIDKANFDDQKTVSEHPALQPQAQPPVVDSSVAQLDWPALTERIQSCQACGLCDKRRQAVVGVGPAQARWMVVGEAPGEQEDRQGEPFVGPAGQLLDAMLAAMGLDRREHVYIANVIKCRPPQNRNPEPEEVARCQPYVLRQIELVQPQLILALGKFAAQSLLAGVVPDVERVPLGRLRGEVHRVPRLGDLPVVVSYHPAYLLRNPVDKAKAWADLCLAMHELDHMPPGLG